MKYIKIRSCIGIMALVLVSCTQERNTVSLKKYTDEVVFKNKGTVSRDMIFSKVEKKGFYVETDEKYRYMDGPNYLFEKKGDSTIEPPSGMRSSVPLGGFGAGSVELRADGGFMDWDIFNNSPATGNDKIQLNDAFMGLYIQADGKKAFATTLRTHPPKKLPAVQQLEYSGAFPVSRLNIQDSNIPLKTKLYAYSEYKIRNSIQSATPCALFSLELENVTDDEYQAAFLFNLPNHIQGLFNVDQGLVLTKKGKEPSSGDMTLAANGADEVTYSVADDLNKLWDEFSDNGNFQEDIHDSGQYGAISAKVSLAPGEKRTITIAMGWYFPERPISVEIVGNYYTNLFRSSTEVTEKALSRLPETWKGIIEWNETCFDNSLPDWLQDAMVNSTATIVKTGIWTKDNRFRQWESFACPNIDPIHISFARSLPYDLFFPELKKSIIGAHGAAQRDNGYIPEKLWPRNSKDPLDQPSPGRVLGDCSTSFILSVYASHIWDGDEEFVNEMWPHVKRAAQWQINRSRKFGLPDRLAATYDLSGFGKKDLVSYNAFMHLAAMKAATELAKEREKEDLVSLYKKNIAAAQNTLKAHFWTGTYFRNWWNKDEPKNDDIHIDTQFGQVWSYLLGLGDVIEPELMKSHLEAEVVAADSPYGMKVLAYAGNDRDETGSGVNNTVWQAGSIHWSILNIYLQMNPDKSLGQAKKVINHWRKGLNDQWNYADLTSVTNGYPHTNSHYGRQLMLWGIPLALSGQQFSAPQGVLSFTPRIEAPYKLPFFTAHASGVLEAKVGEPLLLTLKSGHLKLNKIIVDDQTLTENATLNVGDTIVLDQG
ncbi:GH116 family glycosyl-hydrolase [Zobellia galactanivorans]|uniref:Uncharacterized protein n=1 Tax=Zobellia galactanivorans (strain DSM 12802 / CCUG 47099 / CIP 106680 / NCIMB 13871 / Dsij) TaxID=63186 RepID=G0L9F2_ZOBGA|nr:GH116 family glycosyl-hydrolase [Zobellia galactanivorans]MBU3024048.1 hypothetical protein [Zobellia galactanivorans]CAZ94529.1 Conserved hypothetical protein [Zobellia galactanivorans]